MSVQPFSNDGNEFTVQRVSCFSTQMGYEIREQPFARYPGVFAKDGEKWENFESVSINHNSKWEKVDAFYVNRNGSWQQTHTKLRDKPKTDVKLTICPAEVDSDFGGFSYMVFYIPNQLYIPQGWKIKTIRFSARYDQICDGIFLGQSPQLSASLNQTRRQALILGRRSSAIYVGSGSNDVGNVSSGIQPSAFRWTTPTWAVRTMDNGNGGNMQAVQMYTPNTNTNGMCSGFEDGPTTVVRLDIPSTYRLPFPVDEFTSIRYSDECGGCERYCNHHSCDDTSFLEFSEV